ncbi:MAG TPA: hypothetical protein VK988_01300 [Acidimicrobiales bacterium]|nr:hypothetical protein [Acidimicrobiales bacterium]
MSASASLGQGPTIQPDFRTVEPRRKCGFFNSILAQRLVRASVSSRRRNGRGVQVFDGGERGGPQPLAHSRRRRYAEAL